MGLPRMAVALPVTAPLMSVPLDLDGPGGEAKLEMILGHAMEHHEWFGAESTPEDRRQSALWLLTHPYHLTWEVWRGSELVGILLLWRITPKVDAVVHFVFFDRNLVGKVRLLRNFLRYCFDDLGFQRLSMEVPEDVEKLISFARRKLSFRYEGESAVQSHPLVADLERWRGKDGKPNVWAASVGSRRERSHWRDGKWLDTICLRLLAPEFRELYPGG